MIPDIGDFIVTNGKTIMWEKSSERCRNEERCDSKRLFVDLPQLLTTQSLQRSVLFSKSEEAEVNKKLSRQKNRFVAQVHAQFLDYYVYYVRVTSTFLFVPLATTHRCCAATVDSFMFIYFTGFLFISFRFYFALPFTAFLFV